MIITKVDELDINAENLICDGFEKYAEQNQISVDYTPFNFVAKDNDNVIGVITGYAYYNEVHICDLILDENSRKQGIGSKLLHAVESYFKDKGYDYITLSTYEFQAPQFYLKNGFEIEYIRENKDNSKLTKYFLRKMY